MFKKKKKKKKRVCVIGLDGVPYALLLDLCQRGIMPHMSRLIESGNLHMMKASLPEISAVSWTDFMTGANPGRHGIFGFTDLKPDSYDLRFPNFMDLKTPTFWDKLGKQNRKSIIINQPSTYPARRINGILISGFVAIDLAKAVYPLSLKTKLEEMNYQIDIDTLRCREDTSLLWESLEKTLSGRMKAFDSLWDDDWDYFEFVITGTDRLHHFLWTAYESEAHPQHARFLDYYRRIDGVIQEIASAYRRLAKNMDGFFLLSDHGFCGIEQEVYLNAWLTKNGYLVFESSSPEKLREISPSALAFALDPNRIYIHSKGKYPNGRVDDSERQQIKDDIKKDLEKLRYADKKVVRKVFDTKEIYSGPHVDHGPDLIVLSEKGFDMKGSVKKKEIFGRTSLEGMHTWDDAFFWSEQKQDKVLEISDLAEIFMEKLG